jgi:hypothetical protein
MSIGSTRIRTILILAAAPVVASSLTESLFAATSTARPILTTNLLQARQVRFNSAVARTNITAYPLNSPPINGFTPQLVFGMTNEWDNDDFTFAAHPSSTPAAAPHGPWSTLPTTSATPGYATAIFDTGSSANLITLNEWENTFDLVSASRDGTYEATLQGSGPETETVLVNDAAGFYVTGFGNATVTGGSTIGVKPGSLIGQYNVSTLSAEVGPPNSILPNIAGSPMLSTYQGVIRNTRQRMLTIGADTLTTPQVDFQPLSSNNKIPGGYSRIDLSAQSPSGVATPAPFFPSLENINKIGDNPTSPTNWAALMCAGVGGQHVDSMNNPKSFSNKSFLFDTGAQVTVLSQNTAAACGFKLGGEDPSTPDFFVDVGGVGGVTQSVPGFYLNELDVPSTGSLTYTHVPVLVLDLINPATGSGFVDGILGMNLFTDRDMIINGGSVPYAAVGPAFREWSGSGGGSWSDTTKWSTGTVPNNLNTPAVFRGSITAASTVTLSSNVTVGSLTFDSANAYTIAGSGRITMQTSADSSPLGILGVPANIWVGSGTHAIAAPMTFATNTTIELDKAASSLTISSDVSAATTTVTKLGPGSLQMKDVRASGLTVNEGKLTVLQNGGQSGTSKVGALNIVGGTVDLKDNDLVVTGGTVGTFDGSNYTGISGLIKAGRNGGAWNGATGLVTSMTAATTSHLTTLGVAKASQTLGIANTATGVWSGQTVTGSDALVMYTYAGDATLDGKINVDDYTRIDFNVPLGTSGYGNGDFNYDGKINVDDYTIIDFNVGIQGASLLSGADDAGSSIVAVPEPVSVGLAATSLLLLRRRRRRD